MSQQARGSFAQNAFPSSSLLSQPTSKTLEPSSTIPLLLLPSTPSIIPQLLKVGCPLAYAQRLSNHFVSLTTELRSACENYYHRAYLGLEKLTSPGDLHRLGGDIRLIMETRFSKNVDSWGISILKMARARAQPPEFVQDRTSSQRSAFKHVGPVFMSNLQSMLTRVRSGHHS